jgi:hypothetical protein
LAAIVGIAVVFDVRPLIAGLIAALGFVVQRLLGGIGGNAADRVERWFWRMKSGQESQHTPAEMLELLRQRQQGEGPRP